MINLFVLVICLQIKHFICDWVIQTDYEINHKGKYFHIGGITHSLKHGVGTFLVLLPFDINLSFLLGLLDFITHYNIDWLKQNVTIRLNLSPKDKLFWLFIGVDQLLHNFTYLLIIYFYYVTTLV